MARAKAIKDFDAYEKRVYIASQAFQVQRKAGSGSSRDIEVGEEFYIRRATSSPGWRVVFSDEGVTHVYTVGSLVGESLLEMSAPVGEEEDD